MKAMERKRMEKKPMERKPVERKPVERKPMEKKPMERNERGKETPKSQDLDPEPTEIIIDEDAILMIDDFTFERKGSSKNVFCSNRYDRLCGARIKLDAKNRVIFKYLEHNHEPSNILPEN